MQVQQMTAKQLKSKLEQGEELVLLDVREPFEFEYASIKGSLNIPMGEVPKRYSEVSRDQDCVVICHSGIRSRQVVSFLVDNGYQQVFNLQGGIDQWSLHCDNNVPRY